MVRITRFLQTTFVLALKWFFLIKGEFRTSTIGLMLKPQLEMLLSFSKMSSKPSKSMTFYVYFKFWADKSQFCRRGLIEAIQFHGSIRFVCLTVPVPVSGICINKPSDNFTIELHLHQNASGIL